MLRGTRIMWACGIKRALFLTLGEQRRGLEDKMLLLFRGQDVALV